MSDADQNTTGSLGGRPRDERIGELINCFFDRRERGEPLSEEQFLAEHPDYAVELGEHLASLNLIQDLDGSAEATLPGRASPPPAGSSATDALDPKNTPLPDIPGYDILKQIGRGGMGLVFKAIQRSTKRVVALKLLLEGPFASDVARHRFQREIALAAQLRHPNIIPIYDSGLADGRMYYAMEHVYGLPLMDYVRANELVTGAKLALFTRVCDAVSHAHQRGVVHRDLKPSNILVDGSGDPHVFDFGLAKAGSVLDAQTSVTAQIVGTPAYMSPEQAAGDPSSIDTRTDVYSLGIILYEMLTGRMPYDTTGAMGQTLQNIAHADPEPPARLDRTIDGDLSAIVLKTLEKNKDIRYQSVPEISSDIRRYLAGEPISAKPTTGFYLLRKAVWKHRKVFAVSVVLAIIAGAAGYFFYGSRNTLRELRLQHHALEERVKAREAENQELQQKTTALEQQRQATVEQGERQLAFVISQLLPNATAEERRAWIKIAKLAYQGDRAALLAGIGKIMTDLSTGADDQGYKSKLPLIENPFNLPAPDAEITGTAETSGLERTLEALARQIGKTLVPTPGPATQPAATSTPAAPEPTSSQPSE